MKRFALKATVVLFSGLLAACGEQLSSEEYIARATALSREGKQTAAIVELKNAVAADTRNPEARWLLGRSYFETGDIPEAEKELQRARELGMPDEAVLPLLAQSLVLLEKGDEALQLDPGKLSPSAQAAVLAAQGLAKLSLGKPTEASTLLDRALEKDSKSSYALVAHARLLLANQSIAPARAELERAIAIEPGYASAWSLLGDLEMQEGNTAKAEEDYSKAIDLTANNFSERLKRALLRIQTQRFDEAKQDIDALAKQSPRHPGVRYAEGLVQFNQGELEKAKESLEQASQAEQTYPLALLLLGVINAQQDNIAQAQSYADMFLAVAPGNVEGSRLAAMLEMQQKNYAKAEELLRVIVDAGTADPAALNLFANALMAQGKSDEAIAVLTKLAELEPESAEAQLRLGAGLLAQGQQAVGLERLEVALKLQPELQLAEVLLVLAHIRSRDFSAAINVAEKFRDKNPESVTSYNLLGRAYLASGDDAKAMAAFQKALEIAPGDPEASDQLASLAVNSNDFEAARRYYDNVLERKQNYLPAMMKLAALYALQGDEAGMLAAMERANKAHPSEVEPKLALGHYYLSRADSVRALALLSELDASQKKQPRVLSVLGAAQLEQRDYLQAKQSYARLVELEPNVAQHHYQLAMAYAGLNDGDAMKRELESAIKLDPRQLRPRIALARYLVSKNDREAFQEQLKELHAIQAGHPDVLALDATAAAMQGRDKDALAGLEQVYAKTPNKLNLLNLVLQKRRMGDDDGAISLLKEWVATHPEDMEIRLTLADLYQRKSLHDLAVAQYAAVLELDGHNIMALNNLAWSLRETEPEKALGYAKRAAELQPGSPEVLDTLAVVSLRNGQLVEARRAIERALAKAPGDATLHFHRALIARAQGDNRLAIDILSKLLGTDRQFPDRAEAEALLNSLRQ